MSTLAELRAGNRGLTIPGEPVWLTGYCDASFKPDAPGAGAGFGLWVRDSQVRALRAEPCPPWVRCSNEAELCGAFGAVHCALGLPDAPRAHGMMIKTDSRVVQGWVLGDRPSSRRPRRVRGSPGLRPEVEDLLRRALERTAQARIKLFIRWVKGHQRKDANVRNYLNNRVDALAREARLHGARFQWSCRVDDSNQAG